MYKILKAGKLAGNIYEMVVEAPRVAKHCLPGQFIIVKMDEVGERIPLTICDYDREAGAIALLLEKEPHLTNVEVKMRLKNCARNLNLPKYQQGWGMIDVNLLLT